MNCIKSSITLAATLLVSPILFGQSQNLPNANPQATTNATDLNSLNSMNNSSNPAAMKDKKFLHEAGEGGLAEIKFGQLASQKGSSDDVKQFGQRMVTDHTQLNDDLKPFAAAKGLPAPTKLAKKDQAEYNKLNGLSGDAFDKEYVSMMVMDHKKDMQDFTTEANSTQDPQLKTAVQKGVDVIQQHLTSIQEIAKSKGISGGMSSGQ